MIGFDEAVSLVRSFARPSGKERVELAQAHNRILCAPVRAKVDAPPTDSSAMDGYAVRDADLATVPARLQVVGESCAGRGYAGDLSPGTCVRIFTGAPVPPAADRVVVQEMVRREGDQAVIERPPGEGRHIRRRASDFASGDLLLPAGRRLNYRALVAAAGADHDELGVWRQPRIFLLSTGDELVEPGSAGDGPNSIPESVSFGVAALAREWGGKMAACARLKDDLSSMEKAARSAASEADLVVVTGGASVGERDFAKRMFEPLGLELVFSKVAIKPGKPVWLGRAGATLVFGLPGNPTSALVTARLLLAPLVAGMAGLAPDRALAWRRVPLAGALGPCGERETFVRARCANDAAQPIGNQDSSAQKALAEADLLLRRRANAPAIAAGAIVEALDF